VLKEEDIHDKQLFRQKVKEKHRQQRQRLKQTRREKEEEESDDQSESDHDDDQLPDLDKVYGKRLQSEEDSEEEPSEKKSKRWATEDVSLQEDQQLAFALMNT